MQYKLFRLFASISLLVLLSDNVNAQYTSYFFLSTAQNQKNSVNGILNSKTFDVVDTYSFSLGLGIEKKINSNLLLRVSYFNKSTKGKINRKDFEDNNLIKYHSDTKTIAHNFNSYIIKQFKFNEFTFLAGFGFGYSFLPYSNLNYKTERFTNDTLVSTTIITYQFPKQFSYQLHGIFGAYYKINKSLSVGIEIDNLIAYTITKGNQDYTQRLSSYNNTTLAEIHQIDEYNNKVFFTQYLIPTIGISYSLSSNMKSNSTNTPEKINNYK
jgi:hypothetical protein